MKERIQYLCLRYLKAKTGRKGKIYRLLLLLIPVVMNCTPGSASQHGLNSSSPIVITFAVFHDEQAAYLELARRFEEENPDISINIISLYERLGPRSKWPDNYPRQIAQIADTVYEQIPARFQGQDLFLDLRPFIESDPFFNQEDFFPGSLTTDAVGRITRLPGPLHLWGILYDKDILKVAGVPYPQPGWTWEELLHTAKRLSSPSAGKQEERLYGFLPNQRHARYCLLAQGGDVLRSGLPPRINMTNPLLIDALEWYASLFLIHQVAPHWSDLGFSTPWQAKRTLVNARKVAMWGGKSSDLDTWELSSRNLGFVPYPQSLGANRYFEYQGYMISVGTQHPQEAWRWISWLSYQDIPPFGLSYSTNTLPPRRSVAEASNAWERLNPDVAAAFRWVFDNVSDFSPPLNDILVDGSFANCIRRGIDKALLAVLVDRESAEVALAQAQAWVMDQFVNAIEQQAALEAHPIVVHTSRPELRPLADGIEIEFLISTGDVKPYKELAKDFQQEHPEISVHVELHGPSLTKTHRQPQLDIMAQRAPCFEGVPTISLIDRQMLLDLTPLLESDPRLSQEDFFAVFLYPLLWDDQLLGLPALGSVPLIAYNRELFDRLGHPYPPLDWDWDDFLRFSQLLAADGETGKCYAYSGFSEVLDLFRILRGYDAYPWEMGYIAQPRFSDPRVVATVEWYVNLHRVHGIKPQYRLAQPSYDELQETISLILKERVAMWDSNIPLVPPGEELPFEVGYTAYPVKRGFYIGDIPWSTAYFISSHATPKEIEACWTWLTYLSEHVLPLSEYTYTWNNAVPARRDTAKSDAYRVRMGEDRYAAILHTLEHFRPPEEMINADAAMFYRWVPPADWFLQAVEAIVEGEAAEAALMRAQEKAMAYIICFDNAAPGDDPRQTAKTCAQQVDPGYQMPGGE